MATQIKPPAGRLYDEDFYVWSKAQAELLRAGRFGDLDLEHLIEEVDDLGESLYRSARSRIRTIIEHLLKLEHSPAVEPRAGGRSTVLAQRDDLRDDLTPTLRRRAAADLPELFEQARNRANVSLRDHGEQSAADTLPKACPYTLDRITGDWLP
jgi:Domain of unknown function DUF29